MFAPDRLGQAKNTPWPSTTTAPRSGAAPSPTAPKGSTPLIAWLARFGDPADLSVATWRPTPRLVDRLLEAGHPVVPFKTGAIRAWRQAEVVSGAKSDPGDA